MLTAQFFPVHSRVIPRTAQLSSSSFQVKSLSSPIFPNSKSFKSSTIQKISAKKLNSYPSTCKKVLDKICTKLTEVTIPGHEFLMANNMRSSRSRSPRESRDKSPTPQKRTSLLVRNIVKVKKDQQVKPDELRDYFSKFGEVRDVYIPRDYYSQKSRGFCFVEFLKYDDAREALEKSDGTEVLGSTVKIVFAREGRKAVFFI